MALTRHERKERLGHGAQKEIAEKLGVSDSLVSAVVNDKTQILGEDTVRRVRVAIARRIGLPVDEVFPPREAIAS